MLAKCCVCCLADLGGLLGLFLGGSAISIFEIVDLFVYNLALHITYSKANKKSKAHVRHTESNQCQLAEASSKHIEEEQLGYANSQAVDSNNLEALTKF